MGTGFAKVSKKALQKRIEDASIGSNFDSCLKSKYTSIKYRTKDGDNFIRPLPPVEGEDEFIKEIYLHYWKTGDYLCREKMKGEDCPFCEKYRKFLKKGEDEELISRLRPTRRFLMWILDTSDDAQSKDPLLFLCPPTLADEIARRSKKRRSGEILDIWDAEEGREVIFSKTGKGINTKYVNIEISEDPYPISRNLAEKVVPLRKVLKWEEPDTLAKIAGSITIKSIIESEQRRSEEKQKKD